MSMQVYQRYLSLLAQHVVDVSPQRRWCPAPGCCRSLQLLLPQTLQQQQQQQQAAYSSAACSSAARQQQQDGTAAAASVGGDDWLMLMQQALQAGRGVDVECSCGCR
jgi:hypothetical protein